MSSGGIALPAEPAAGREPRAPAPAAVRQHAAAVVAGTRHHDEVRQVEHGRVAVPGFDFCERVHAEDEENLRCARRPSVEAIERVGGVRRCPGRVSSTSLASSTVDAVDGERRHRETVKGRRGRLHAAGAAARATAAAGRGRAPSASRAASAVSTCPTWTGSSVPPRIPRRTADAHSANFIPCRGRRRRGAAAATRSRSAARSRAASTTSRHTASSSDIEPFARGRRHSVERNARARANTPAGARAAPARRAHRPCWPPRAAACRRGVRRTHRVPGTAPARGVMISKSSTGSRPVVDDTSTRCTSTLVRSRWLRNRWPRPCPSCAPSIRPGTSATTNDRSPDSPTTPRFGTRVVNG